MIRSGRPLCLPPEFAQEDFLSAAKSALKGKTCIRLLAMHHLQQGKTQTEAAEQVGTRQQNVQKWLNRYRKSGLQGLTAKTGQGRKAQLTLSQEVEFKRLFELKQAESEGGSLTGYDACLLLAAHFTPLSQSSAYRLLHKVGLSWITGRDIHPKHNAEAQADFKKTLSTR